MLFWSVCCMKKEICLLKIGRWHTPKSKSIVETTYNYICTGCYDALDIKTLGTQNLEEAYNLILEDKMQETNSELYTDRRIVMFRDCCETDFKYDCGKNVFVSLLNINNLKVKEALVKIQETFDNEYTGKYALYFSFDYSDIIIVAQDITIPEYNKLINNLNYSGEFGIIFDTLTLYGIPTQKSKDLMKLIDDDYSKAKILYKVSKDQKFTFKVDFHLDVNDNSVLSKLKQKFDEVEYSYNISSLALGRYDYIVTIKFQNEMQFLYSILIIDKYSSSNNTNRISSCEFILLPEEQYLNNLSTNCSEATYSLEKYEQAKTYFNGLFSKFKKSYTEFCNNNEEDIKDYWCANSVLTTMTELINSLLAFYKNNVADEFLICVFEPIESFIEYSISFFNNNDNKEKISEYAEFFRSFFGYLQQLTYTTIHSNRRFMQVNSFNSAYYDVPPKLLALYAIWAKEISQEIGANRYTFLFAPTFSNDIVLKLISPQLDENNIVIITMGESILYNPLKFRRLLYHEIAHYVGKPEYYDIRNRALRKEYLIKIYIYHLLSIIFPERQEWFKRELTDSIFSALSTTHFLDNIFDVSKNNRTADIEHIFNDFIFFLSDYRVGKILVKTIDTFMNDILKKSIDCNDIKVELTKIAEELDEELGVRFYSNCLSSFDYQSENSNNPLSGYIVNKFFESFNYISKEPNILSFLNENSWMYLYAFKEGFSDINMTIYMDMSKDVYRNLIPTYENNYGTLNSDEIRVSGVMVCMTETGSDWERENKIINSYPYELYVRYLIDCSKLIRNRKNKELCSKSKKKSYENICCFDNVTRAYVEVVETATKELEKISSNIRNKTE